MSRTNKQLVLSLLALIVITGGIVGCADRNTEAPGKHDSAEVKAKRQDKKGD